MTLNVRDLYYTFHSGKKHILADKLENANITFLLLMVFDAEAFSDTRNFPIFFLSSLFSEP